MLNVNGMLANADLFGMAMASRCDCEADHDGTDRIVVEEQRESLHRFRGSLSGLCKGDCVLDH